jgi:hypothetical protein
MQDTMRIKGFVHMEGTHIRSCASVYLWPEQLHGQKPSCMLTDTVVDRGKYALKGSRRDPVLQALEDTLIAHN